jgi:hypothetical protein
MKQLVFRLAWARFRTNPEIHFDKHLRDCWTLSKQTKKAKKRKLVFSASPHAPETAKPADRQVVLSPPDLRHHLPDKGRSAKHSSVYRQEKKNGSYQVLGGTKSEIKVANRIANRRKVSGAPVGMYSPQRLVGDLSRTNFKIQ